MLWNGIDIHWYTSSLISVKVERFSSFFFKATTLYTDKRGGVGGSQFEKCERGLNMAMTPAHIRSAVDLKAGPTTFSSYPGSWMSQFLCGRVLLKRDTFFLSLNGQPSSSFSAGFHQRSKKKVDLACAKTKPTLWISIMKVCAHARWSLITWNSIILWRCTRRIRVSVSFPNKKDMNECHIAGSCKSDQNKSGYLPVKREREGQCLQTRSVGSPQEVFMEEIPELLY